MCNSKSDGKVCFWKLEENKDAIRLNCSIKTIQDCLITPDEEYMIVTNQSD